MFDGRPLIVGVGNAFRSDDGVGPLVAETLASKGFETQVHAGDGTGLMQLFETRDGVVLVDATRSGAEPGTLIALDALAGKLPADLFHYSTHRFGLAEAVETARALDALPKRLLVYGIEGRDFGSGTDLSEPVMAAARRLVARLAREFGPENSAVP